jgi:hypothetical protein
VNVHPPGSRTPLRREGPLLQHQPGDQLVIGGSVLDIVADGLAILAQVEHDIFLKLDGARRRERAQLDVEAVGGAIVARLHGRK